MDNQLRELIDKTAKFIAEQGSDFEARLLEKEKSNAKLSFLQENDENHMYYRQRVEFFKNMGGDDDGEEYKLDGDDDEVLEKKRKEDKWYDKIIETAILSSTPFEIDVIKLTAQYIAMNGESFMLSLQTKYNEEVDYSFMDEEHHLNSFFQFLLKSYKSIYERLNHTSTKENDTDEDLREKELEKILDRVKWNRLKMDENGDKGEKEATTMAAVMDWSNFIVVNTITFNEDQLSLQRLPPPTTLTQLRSLPFLPPKPSSSLPSLNNNQIPPPNVNPIQPQPKMPMPVQSNSPPNTGYPKRDEGKIEILEDYKPGMGITMQQREEHNKKVSAITTQICPRCGQSIPIHQMEEHMRIELMDTRFLEQRRMQDQMKLNITTDEDMSFNLVNFFTKRSQQEQSLVNSINEGDNKRKREEGREISWDNKIPPNPNLPQAQSLSGQIKSLYMKDSNPNTQQQLPPPPLMKTPSNPNIPKTNNKNGDDDDDVVPSHPLTGFGGAPSFLNNLITAVNLDPNNFIPEENPSTKKVKTESQLIPEQEFLSKFSSHVLCLLVQVPKSDKKGKGKLLGQTLKIDNLNLTDKISTLKEKITELTEIPVNKQKLKYSNTFLNDNNSSLAFYNLTDGNVLALSLKERGGRR